MIGAILFFLFACVAGLDAAMAFGNAQTIMQQIYGALMLILAGVMLLGATLCALDSRIAGFIKLLKTYQNNEEQRQKERNGLTEERWETLAASLEKLEQATRRDPPPAQILDDIDPLPDPVKQESIRVRCWKCGKVVKAKNEWAGKHGKCPGCGGSIEFPAQLNSLI